MLVVNRDPTPKQLTQFALAALLFFGGMGALLFWGRGHTTSAFCFWVAAVVVGIGGLVSRSWARTAYLTCITVAYPIGLVLSYLILLIIYFLILTPVGILLRLFGKDPLLLGHEPNRSSYWHSLDEPESADSYYKQF